MKLYGSVYMRSNTVKYDANRESYHEFKQKKGGSKEEYEYLKLLNSSKKIDLIPSGNFNIEIQGRCYLSTVMLNMSLEKLGENFNKLLIKFYKAVESIKAIKEKA